MKNPVNKILEIVEDSACVTRFSSSDWNLLISQARLYDLIPFVYHEISDMGHIQCVPVEILQLMDGYVTRLEYLKTLYLWDLKQIEKLAVEFNVQVIVLKGMAYLIGELGIYKSRNFADIDLLVKGDDFKFFEKKLTSHGWHFKELNDYDDHYYREWSHASPPMTNILTGLELDLHHHISSPISDIKVDTQCLLDKALEVKGSTLFRLSDEDVILHCANHFIYFDDVHGKFKDILHIHYMIKQNPEEDIWLRLYQRAQVLGLESTLFYMVGLLEHFFKVEPAVQIREWQSNFSKNPKKLVLLYLLKYCLSAERVDSVKYKLMTSLLVVRYQWTRYPLNILMTHLVKKHLIHRFIRWRAPDKKQDE